ncbi:hypothetical protein F5882DRAFT_444769 [Hyaloscypha sp. PMI_1271]|nr:hypothetical protein F5882DRAFT_444769 [Hyaloscypha sp. PMI_1271]
MISSISSSPIHKPPELAAFHKPQQPLPLDLATHHKPRMATQGPTSDITAAIQPLLGDLTLADSQQTFTLFPRLPPELRLKILKDALPVGHKGRRFIRVKARIGAPSPRSKEPCWFIVDNNAYSSDLKDVGLLGVNKEFRHVYLRHFDKTLAAKGVGLIRYHENDIIFISNLDKLMRNRSIRAVIKAGSRIQDLYNSCTNIAASVKYVIDCHDNHTKWFGGGAHVCPLKFVGRFKKLKTAAAVLCEGDVEKYSGSLGITPDELRLRWWCFLSHAETNMRACKEEEEVGSGKAAPALLLLNEDGEVVEGRRCTDNKCFNEE